MKFVTSLYVDSRQLVVVVVGDDGGTLIAYGIDPHQDPAVEQWEFMKGVSHLGAFLKALVDNDSDGFNANSIEIPTTPPPVPWPKLQPVISYAQALHADEALAFAGAPHAA